MEKSNFLRGPPIRSSARLDSTRPGSARACTGSAAVDIVGLIWRSGINQRANILAGPGNAAAARRRSFYRPSKTIRIYIRASAAARRVCLPRHATRPRRATPPAYGMAYWSGGRATAAITALLPAGSFGRASKCLSLFPPRLPIPFFRSTLSCPIPPAGLRPGDGGGDRAYRGESSFCRDSSLLFDSLFPCFFSFFFFFSGLFLEARKKGVCCSSLFDLRRITDSYFILYFFEEDAFDEIFADS